MEENKIEMDRALYIVLIDTLMRNGKSELASEVTILEKTERYEIDKETDAKSIDCNKNEGRRIGSGW